MLCLNDSTESRDSIRQIVYQLNASGVALALVNGRVSYSTDNNVPLPLNALTILKEHKEGLLDYLITPPGTTRSCAACGRADTWVLDPMGTWVCDCYFHPGLRTWPKSTQVERAADSAHKDRNSAPPAGPETIRPGHGFLMSDVLLTGGQRVPLAAMPKTPEDFLDVALDNRLSHLWVMPDVDIPAMAGTPDEKGREKILTETHDLLLNRKRTGTRAIGSLVGRRRHPHTENSRVIFLKETPYPQEVTGLQSLIDEVEAYLEVEMQASPTSIGLRYLEKVDARYYKRYFERIEKIDWKGAKDDFKAAAHSLIWHRTPDLEEQTRRYLVAYDKRSAFPRAAKEESFGIGQPVHQDSPAFNHLLPGIWYCQVSNLEKIDSRLPAPLWHTWHNPGWLSTQIVKLLLKMGASIKIAEAVIWPEKAPIFERWAGNLWTFRQNSKYPDAVKAMLNNPLGFTIHGQDMEDSTFRPDWNMTIVGSTRASLIYNAMTIAKEGGMYPVGACIDALYYCSSSPTIPGYLEKHPDSLGGYAHKWTLEMDRPIESAASGVHGAEVLPDGATVATVLTSDLAWIYQLQIFNRLVEGAN